MNGATQTLQEVFKRNAAYSPITLLTFLIALNLHLSLPHFLHLDRLPLPFKLDAISRRFAKYGLGDCGEGIHKPW